MDEMILVNSAQMKYAYEQPGLGSSKSEAWEEGAEFEERGGGV
jgi:hypothetical protein